jgi:hypothetical protein
MSRGAYQYWRMSDFKGGINIEPENAKPNQLLDARNVWCPHGILEQRPGYVGVATCPYAEISATSPYLLFENVGTVPSTFTTAAAGASLALKRGVATPANLQTSAQEGDRWYYGSSNAAYLSAVVITVLGVNTASVYAKAQYWNGSAWVNLPVQEQYRTASSFTYGANYVKPSVHLGPGASYQKCRFSYFPPGDWKVRAINGTNKYWIRFTLCSLNGTDATLTLGTIIDNGSVATPLVGHQLVTPGGFFAPQFSSTKRYLGMVNWGESPTYPTLTNGESFPWGNNFSYKVDSPVYGTEPATMAVVPEFDEAFVAWGYQVNRFTPDPSVKDVMLAQVELSPELVGTVDGIKADYHPDYVPQASAFPQAKYVAFFQGQLWASGIKDQPYTVQWSAPEPAYKVWPNESYEVLMENDNSPITGMKATSEYLAVFKQDSIWLMVPSGQSELSGLNTYVPVRRVGGIGCVSNSSIVEINGNLIFLAEDGVYAFNGQTATKISEDLDHLFLEINAGRRPFACATHWRRKHCYLLALSLGSSETNSDIFVYDYAEGCWWRWDNIDAELWLEDEGQFDEETIYFVDNLGHIYELGRGDMDAEKATDAYIVTHRIGYGNPWPVRASEVHLNGVASDLTAMDVVIYRQDDPTGTAGTLDWTDSLEVKLGTFVLGTDKLRPMQRRFRRAVFRERGRWFNVRVENDQKNGRFELSRIDVAMQGGV